MSDEIPLRDPAPLPASPAATREHRARLESSVETGSAPHKVRWAAGLGWLAGLIVGSLLFFNSIVWMVQAPIILGIFLFIAVLHQLAAAWFRRWSHWPRLNSTIISMPLIILGLAVGAFDTFLLQFGIGLATISICWPPFIRCLEGERDITQLKRRNRQRTAQRTIIRDAAEADIPDLLAILPNADHLRRIRSCDGGRARYLVAEFEGHVVGFGRISFEILSDRPAGRPRPPLPWIANMNVRADCRGRGFGTLIIAGLERAARERGLSVAYIGVNKDNTPAYSLYSRLGYKPMDNAPARHDASAAAGPSEVVYLVKQLA